MAFARLLKTVCVGTLLFGVAAAQAQLNPEIAEKLKSIGRVVNPVATAPLYMPRMLEKEPYAGVVVKRDIKYGDNERHVLDVFSLEAASPAPKPVFLFVHGGAFVAGNKRGPNASPFYDNMMLWAVRNGMVGVNMTYRLAPQNKWPAGPEDLGAAVKWVNQEVAKHGGDPAKVYMMGHSAGAAHVAGYIANEKFHQVAGGGLAGALLLSGLYDLVTVPNPTVNNYYGDDLSKRPEQSPLSGMLKSGLPMWIAHAELDPPYFVGQANLARDGLCKAGRCPAFASFPGHSHMSEVYAVHTDDKSVGDALLAFIKAR